MPGQDQFLFVDFRIATRFRLNKTLLERKLSAEHWDHDTSQLAKAPADLGGARCAPNLLPAENIRGKENVKTKIPCSLLHQSMLTNHKSIFRPRPLLALQHRNIMGRPGEFPHIASVLIAPLPYDRFREILHRPGSSFISSRFRRMVPTVGDSAPGACCGIV